MRGDAARPVGERLRFHRYEQGIDALGEHRVQHGHAHLQSEALDHGRRLRGAQIEIDEHARGAAALDDLEHAQQRILLRDHRLPGDLPHLGKNRREPRVLEVLRDHHVEKFLEARHETGPFPIPLVYA